MRPLCKVCNKYPCAINYHKKDIIFYRSKCEVCIRYGGANHGMPKWHNAGYRMKSKCDKCGYKSEFPIQFNVFHIDGHLNNCNFKNLKTVCANCQRTLHKEGFKWKQGDLVPDF